MKQGKQEGFEMVQMNHNFRSEEVVVMKVEVMAGWDRTLKTELRGLLHELPSSWGLA